MDEIKGADKNMDIYKFVFIGSNREKLNFNKFKMPLNFLSSIYNGQTTLKGVEFLQNDLYDKINQLKYNYKPKNVEEKEEINGVLMHASDMLEYRAKLLSHLEMVLFRLNI